MGEYGAGMSLTEAFNNDKERICAALEGMLIVGEDEKGWVYKKADKEECKKYILKCFDNAVYHALQGYRSGKALEETLGSCGIKTEKLPGFLTKYMEVSNRLALEQENREDRYMYEDDYETE